MGRRGPRKTPTGILNLRGSWRAGQRVGEVKVKSEVPTPPAMLSREAKAEWKRVVKELDALGLIAKLDRAALTILCNAWGDYTAARKDLKKEGSNTYSNDKGEIKAHPLVKIMNDAISQWCRMCKEFGMAPASRAGLSPTAKPKAVDPLTALQNRKNIKASG